MLKLVNAFSLNMLQEDCDYVVPEVEKFSFERAKKMLSKDNFESYIGHEDMAKVLSEMTGLKVESRRETLKIKEGDSLLVAQYSGPRLPEGATKLPEGAKVLFYYIFIRGEEAYHGLHSI